MSTRHYAAGAVLFLLIAAVGVAWLWQGVGPVEAPAPPPSLPPAPAQAMRATYYCARGASMQASFPGGAGPLALTLSDGRTLSLSQVPTGSGMRYEDTKTRYGTDVLFVGKGDNAYLSEDGHITYEDCTAAIVEASDAPGYETYTDRAQTFTFAFPSNFSVAGSAIGLAPGWSALATTDGMVLAKVLAPQSLAPGTNFADATFTVGTSADPSAVADCLTSPAGGSSAGTAPQGGGRIAIGTEKFAELQYQGAAAGNRYDTTSYRIVRDNECYAIEYTIHYGVIDNYPKGTVKEFNEQQAAAALDEVARSFRFLR